VTIILGKRDLTQGEITDRSWAVLVAFVLGLSGAAVAHAEMVKWAATLELTVWKAMYPPCAARSSPALVPEGACSDS
jgi:hypothetical protein